MTRHRQILFGMVFAIGLAAEAWYDGNVLTTYNVGPKPRSSFRFFKVQCPESTE